MSKTDDMLRQAAQNIRTGLQEKPDVIVAECTNIEYSSVSSEPIRGTFSAINGDLVTTVPIAGLRVGIGGVAELESSGGVANANYRVRTVLRAGHGVSSPASTVALSTPEIESVTSVATVTINGETLVRTEVSVRRIPENFTRKPMRYEIAFDEAGTTPRPELTVSTHSQAIVAGQLTTTLTAGETGSFTVSSATVEGTVLDRNFPKRSAVVRIGSEEILCGEYDRTTGTFSSLTRGYNGTTAVEHQAGDLVLSLSALATVFLGPNIDYQISVRAIAEDGRTSNYSLVTGHTSAYDTTPPTWSGPVGLTVEVTPYKFTVTWTPADVDANDILHYDVQVSDDGSAWGADGNTHNHNGTSVPAYDAGNGARFVYSTAPETTKHFRVRAVDTSHNASGWSGSVSGTTPKIDPGETDPDPDPVGPLPTDVNFGDAAVGTSDALSRFDHKHHLDEAAFSAAFVVTTGVLHVDASLAGDGMSLSGQTINLDTPGPVSVSSTNDPTGNHTHAVTTSSNPGAAASILATDANGHLQLERLGIGTAPGHPLHVIGAARIDGDLTFVGAQQIATTAGNLTVAPAGDVTFDPTGNDILPLTNYDLNLGAINKKYLTLHAAELWVETLVAQDTLATIGGRVLVGPTTKLESDLAPAATSIEVEHNNLASGDIVYMEANGKVEFMSVDSAPSGTGPYTYTVTRNLDGTGANQWYAGDAVFNTGQAGDGFIDLYSIRGVKASSQAGPTIAGNVRNSATFNDWIEAWAIGNLNGLYGYGVDTYGAAFGQYGTAAYATFDASNGIRFFGPGGTQRAQLTGSTWTLGNTNTEHIQITTAAMRIKDGATVWTEVGAGVMTIGPTGSDHVRISGSAIQLRDGATVKIEAQTDGDLFIGTDVGAAGTTYFSIFSNGQTYNGEAVGAGDLLIGDNSAGVTNILWDESAGRFELRSGTTVRAYIDTTGFGVNGRNVYLNDENENAVGELGSDGAGQFSNARTVQVEANDTGSNLNAVELIATPSTGTAAGFLVSGGSTPLVRAIIGTAVEFEVGVGYVDVSGKAYFGGNVGIGTLSPAFGLHLSDAGIGRSSALFENTDITDTFRLTPRSNGTDDTLTLVANNLGSIIVEFQANQVAHFPGKIGIGTKEPKQPFHVVGNAHVDGSYRAQATFPGVWMDNGDGSDSALIQYANNLIGFQNRGPGFGSVNNVPYKFDMRAGGNALVVDSSGMVGVGLASPQTNLHVSSSGLTGIRVSNDTIGNGAADGFQIDIGTDGIARVANFENQALVFLTNSTNRMHLAANGGLWMQGATGGSQGQGTFNAQAVYDDGTLLTDHLWDLYYDGEMRAEDAERYPDARLWDIDDVREFTRKHRHLPAMPSRHEKPSLGEMVTGLLETIEHQQIQIMELQDQLRRKAS